MAVVCASTSITSEAGTGAASSDELAGSEHDADLLVLGVYVAPKVLAGMTFAVRRCQCGGQSCGGLMALSVAELTVKPSHQAEDTLQAGCMRHCICHDKLSLSCHCH